MGGGRKGGDSIWLGGGRKEYEGTEGEVGKIRYSPGGEERR